MTTPRLTDEDLAYAVASIPKSVLLKTEKAVLDLADLRAAVREFLYTSLGTDAERYAVHKLCILAGVKDDR